jgi:two-component system response regulator PilR (NtrC family)
LKDAAAELIRRLETEASEGGAAELRRRLEELEERVKIARQFLEGRPEADAASGAGTLIGRSAAMLKVKGLISQIAPTRLPVLITGETGTGKELVARAIHGESMRRAAAFVSLNCAALPEELLEAEIFGYHRGAFSGADRDNPGLLRSAHGGTLLFDGVAEMSLAVQAKLLRVLDRGGVRPLGSQADVEVDVRYLFTTNRDLRTLVVGGRFRNDLLFRLGSFEIALPPLRERLDDLPLLVGHFSTKDRPGSAPPVLDDGAWRALASHPWPGNVRELENVITRLVFTCGQAICAQDVLGLLSDIQGEELFPARLLRGRPLEELLTRLERKYLLALYDDCGGDLKAMAASLGIKLRALYKRFTRLGIRPQDLK